MDPMLLRDASFMHKLTTGSEGNVYVEVAYRFYPTDHEIADDGPAGCSCAPEHPTVPSCNALLAFGNYEFSLAATYNEEACTTPFSPKRQEEFNRALHTADRLIGLYLKPLRRKPDWL
jgi:hypothetical protein